MGDLWVATPSSNRFSRDLCVKKATTKFHPTNFLLEDAAKIKNSVVSWSCWRLRSPYDVIQKFEKTLNNTPAHTNSPHARESETVLDSGFGLGFWIIGRGWAKYRDLSLSRRSVFLPQPPATANRWQITIFCSTSSNTFLNMWTVDVSIMRFNKRSSNTHCITFWRLRWLTLISSAFKI